MLDLSFGLIRDPGSGVTEKILGFIKSDKNVNNSDILEVENMYTYHNRKKKFNKNNNNNNNNNKKPL